MVVILILPSLSEQTSPPPTTSTNGCDHHQFNSNRHQPHQQHNNYNEYPIHNNKRNLHVNFHINTESNGINKHRRKSQTSTTAPAVTANTQNTATTSSLSSSKNYVRHVTRVNISDVYSQIEIDGEIEPVTKEGMYPHFFFIF